MLKLIVLINFILFVPFIAHGEEFKGCKLNSSDGEISFSYDNVDGSMVGKKIHEHYVKVNINCDDSVLTPLLFSYKASGFVDGYFFIDDKIKYKLTLSNLSFDSKSVDLRKVKVFKNEFGSDSYLFESNSNNITADVFFEFFLINNINGTTYTFSSLGSFEYLEI